MYIAVIPEPRQIDVGAMAAAGIFEVELVAKMDVSAMRRGAFILRVHDVSRLPTDVNFALVSRAILPYDAQNQRFQADSDLLLSRTLTNATTPGTAATAAPAEFNTPYIRIVARFWSTPAAAAGSIVVSGGIQMYET